MAEQPEYSYDLHQLSLSTYKFINNHSSNLVYKVYKFERSEELLYIDTTTVLSGEESIVTLSEDGIYIIKVFDSTTASVPYHTYVVHNIMNILAKRQEYLTNILVNGKIEECDSHSYYDYMSFNILFNSYIYLVEKMIIGQTETDNINVVPTAIPENLYKVEDIYNNLLEYC